MPVIDFPGKPRPTIRVVKAEAPIAAPASSGDVLSEAHKRAYAATKLQDAIRVCSAVFSSAELTETLQTYIAGQRILAQREARR